MKKTISMASVTAALLLVAGVASAQPKTSKPISASTGTSASANGDYGYIFTDDGLQGGAMAASDSVIHAGRFVDREWLIRPRTSFVQDMLKSVENL